MSRWIKDLNTQNQTKGSRGDRRWTLLFIGDRSKTIAFNHLKAAVIITVLIILVLTGISVGLSYLYRDAVVDIRSLEEKLDALNQTVNSLRDEKDILMARLVMAESRVDGTLTRKEKNATKLTDDVISEEEPASIQSELSSSSRPFTAETASTVSETEKAVYHKVEAGDSLYLISLSYDVPLNLLRKYNDLKDGHMIHPGQMLVIKPGSEAEVKTGSGTETVASTKRAPSPKPAAPKPKPKPEPQPKPISEPQQATLKPEPKPVGQESQSKISVAAEKLTTIFETGTNLLRVEYVLRNTGEKTKPINGQTLVILKKEGKDPNSWLVLPSVPLESGRPKGSEGYFFSIYNYRTIRFRISNQTDIDQFTEAVVYVFSKDGDLVLEKQFTVSIIGGKKSSSDT